MSYFIMHTDFADPLRADGRGFATYGDYILKGEKPKEFEGEIVDLEVKELPKPEFYAAVDTLLASTPTGKMVKIGDTEGRELQKNHPYFQPKQTEEI